MIRYFESRHTGKARITHVALAMGDAWPRDRHLIEASWRVRAAAVRYYMDTPMIVFRARPEILSERERVRAAVMAAACLRDTYGFGKIMLTGLDCLFRTYWFTQRFGLTHYKHCANLVAWALYQGTGRHLFGGLNWRSVTPDLIDDWCSARMSDWDVVWNTL
jgi:hypothetical protein